MKGINASAMVNLVPETILDFNHAKKNLFIKAVNINSIFRKFSREDCIYEYADSAMAGDIVLVPYILVSDSSTESAMAMVNKPIMSAWGMDDTNLIMETAKKNSERLLPIFIDKLEHFILEDTSNNTVLVLTNIKSMFGASALFYDGIMEKLHHKIGNYYVLPSSIHELIIVPVFDGRKQLNQLRDMVKSVNSFCVRADEFLSNNIYMFDGETFKIAKEEV